MNDSVHEATKDALRQNFDVAISEAEQLLRSVATTGSETANALLARVEQSLETAQQRLQRLRRMALNAASARVRDADELVHKNPWQAIGVAATLGALLGVVIGVLVTRR